MTNKTILSNDKYSLIVGSALGHCCIEYSIVFNNKSDYINQCDMVCECTSLELAKEIFSALIDSDKLKE